jgi:LPXTG-motif cell wall-anchored protein
MKKNTLYILGGLVVLSVAGYFIYKKMSKPKTTQNQGGENVKETGDSDKLSANTKQSNTITFVR